MRQLAGFGRPHPLAAPASNRPAGASASPRRPNCALSLISAHFRLPARSRREPDAPKLCSKRVGQRRELQAMDLKYFIMPNKRKRALVLILPLCLHLGSLINQASSTDKPAKESQSSQHAGKLPLVSFYARCRPMVPLVRLEFDCGGAG